MVKTPRPEVVWSKRAYNALEKTYQYIKQDSPANAEKVRQEILQATANLASHPERYPLDKFKHENNGEYRAFELHSLRVAYRFTKDKIKIIRVRHVKQEPKQY